MGESMKQKTNYAKVKVLSKTTFSMWQFFIGSYYIFDTFFKLNIKFKAKI
jgi:hypothetical protein